MLLFKCAVQKPEDTRNCRLYKDWWWSPSINLILDDFGEEYIEKARTATCPDCGVKIQFDVLVVGSDGVWRFRELTWMATTIETGALPAEDYGAEPSFAVHHTYAM